MVNNVAIIPARGGSKGLPGKNIRKLAGLPLLAHSIQHCLDSENFKAVYVTTDSEEIAAISHHYGAKVIERPDTISDDTATSESALIHALTQIEKQQSTVNYVCFLQCTSPIRQHQDLDNALLQMRDENSDSLLTVVDNHGFLWSTDDQGLPQSINYDYKKRQRRQDLKPQFQENGSFYIFKPWVLKQLNNRLGGKISLYKMPEETAYEIDSAIDFQIVDTLMSAK